MQNWPLLFAFSPTSTRSCTWVQTPPHPSSSGRWRTNSTHAWCCSLCLTQSNHRYDLILQKWILISHLLPNENVTFFSLCPRVPSRSQLTPCHCGPRSSLEESHSLQSCSKSSIIISRWTRVKRTTWTLVVEEVWMGSEMNYRRTRANTTVISFLVSSICSSFFIILGFSNLCFYR